MVQGCETGSALLTFDSGFEGTGFAEGALCARPLQGSRSLSLGPFGEPLVVLIQPASDISGDPDVVALICVPEEVDSVEVLGCGWVRHQSLETKQGPRRALDLGKLVAGLGFEPGIPQLRDYETDEAFVLIKVTRPVPPF